VGKFICMDGRGHDPMTFKRNLHSFGVSPLILGGSACLFLKQPKSRGCDVTSCSPQSWSNVVYVMFQVEIHNYE
jgi:hypothetical protein